MVAAMTENFDTRRKRLYFQACHRGTKEADFLIGGFAGKRLATLDDGQLDRFEDLLARDDIDLVAWVTGLRAAPADLDHDVMRLMIDYTATLHPPS